MNVILNGYYTRREPEEHLITDLHELDRMSFAQIIQGRFGQYVGWDIWDIVGTLNLHAAQTRDELGFPDIPVGVMNNKE